MDEVRDKVHVVVTGTGAFSSLGNSGDEILGALAAGRRGFAPLRSIDPSLSGVGWAGEVSIRPEERFGDRNYRMIDRTGQLVLIASGAALAASGLDAAAIAGREVGLLLGTLFGSVNTIASFDRRGMEAGPKYVKPLDFANSVINAAAGQAAIWHDLRGINSTVTGGATAALQAMGQAFDLIRDGRAELLLAGGAEELSLEGLLGFSRAGWLAAATGEEPPTPEPFGRQHSGMVVGEGAAFLLLEDAASARARGAEPLAELLGHGAAFDPSRLSDESSAAQAIARAIAAALADAGLSPADIDLVVVSASGLHHLDRCEALGLELAFGEHLASLPWLAPKRCLGETFGAGGAFAALIALAALRQGEVPAQRDLVLDPDLPVLRSPATSAKLAGRRALLLALAYDGAAAALIFEAYPPAETT